jgi:hypothetical protein
VVLRVRRSAHLSTSILIPKLRRGYDAVSGLVDQDRNIRVGLRLAIVAAGASAALFVGWWRAFARPVQWGGHGFADGFPYRFLWPGLICAGAAAVVVVSIYFRRTGSTSASTRWGLRTCALAFGANVLVGLILLAAAGGLGT